MFSARVVCTYGTCRSASLASHRITVLHARCFDVAPLPDPFLAPTSDLRAARWMILVLGGVLGVLVGCVQSISLGI